MALYILASYSAHISATHSHSGCCGSFPILCSFTSILHHVLHQCSDRQHHHHHHELYLSILLPPTPYHKQQLSSVGSQWMVTTTCTLIYTLQCIMPPPIPPQVGSKSERLQLHQRNFPASTSSHPPRSIRSSSSSFVVP